MKWLGDKWREVDGKYVEGKWAHDGSLRDTVGEREVKDCYPSPTLRIHSFFFLESILSYHRSD